MCFRADAPLIAKTPTLIGMGEFVPNPLIKISHKDTWPWLTGERCVTLNWRGCHLRIFRQLFEGEYPDVDIIGYLRNIAPGISGQLSMGCSRGDIGIRPIF